ncbi:MAG TPA: quinone oxidoreductase [Thermoanaerobaculia bacterium]|nr:quinone oxidoreductase [Thermoanaerobaculia bacterium]
MHAIQVRQTGGPEALEYVETDKPNPKAGEVLVRLESIGINFIDVYHRTGLYKLPLPLTPGSEGAGVVEETGEGVRDFKKGDRVAWAMSAGSYADYAVVAASKLVPIPDRVDFKTAAAAMLQGMTAHYLALSTYPLKIGESALVHAAAGGVGGLLVQIAKMRGARVFGTVSTDEKAKIAREDGADAVIKYTETDFEAETLRLTNGIGVNVVYDSVGKTTFDKSLNCVARRGLLALFGQSSGPVPPFDPARLAKNGIYLTRPSLAHYTAERDELLWRARDVLSWIGEGKLRLRIDREIPLRDAAEAHRLLESRKTMGKLLLKP